MYLFTRSLKSGQAPVRAACEELGRDFPALMRHAVIAGVRLPGTLRQLDDGHFGGKLHGYAMCLNHWLRFLPVPVILLNTEWFGDDARLRARYRHDAATGYHPDCGCPFQYILAHEIAHFIYGQMGPEDRKKWETIFEPGKPSGYGTTPEESFCEAFAGGASGLKGRHFGLASVLAKPYASAPDGRVSRSPSGQRPAQP